MITNEIINDVGGNVLERALRQSELGRHYSALTYLSALSDYPDALFDYEQNEQKINKMIREAYKNLNCRQAFLPFIQIQGESRAQNSRKLAQKLLKEFSTVYRQNFHEASTHQLIKIVEKYTSHGWMIADTYNSLIAAFGKKFEEFSFKELASFTQSLG